MDWTAVYLCQVPVHVEMLVIRAIAIFDIPSTLKGSSSFNFSPTSTYHQVMKDWLTHTCLSIWEPGRGYGDWFISCCGAAGIFYWVEIGQSHLPFIPTFHVPLDVQQSGTGWSQAEIRVLSRPTHSLIKSVTLAGSHLSRTCLLSCYSCVCDPPTDMSFVYLGLRNSLDCEQFSRKGSLSYTWTAWKISLTNSSFFT